jgi:hypothetical protein
MHYAGFSNVRAMWMDAKTRLLKNSPGQARLTVRTDLLQSQPALSLRLVPISTTTARAAVKFGK